LILNGIAMVAADTTRTLYYLEELIKNKLLPTYVLLLLNTQNKLLPGQESSDSRSKLVELLSDANIDYEISVSSDINSADVISQIRKREEPVFIFSGFGGVLLRDDVLATGKKFLHVHGGYLPDFKGSTTNYYSLIHENTIGASSIFLTKDIDCGPVLLRKKFAPPRQRIDIDHIHDSEARAQVLILTLQNYVTKGRFIFELESNIGGETFYIIHPLLKHLAILGD
jgi:methionyl-tRNA formyltransferase